MYRSSNQIRFVHFADDTAVFAFDSDINNVHATVNRELVGIDNWLKANGHSLNVSKTSCMIISKEKAHSTTLQFEIQSMRKFQRSNFLALNLMKISLLMTMQKMSQLKYQNVFCHEKTLLPVARRRNA